jgi:uncharacterized protein YbjT (DUF2867 family)
MKITVTGSLGNISRILTEKLVADGHEVRVISSHPERAGEIEKLHAIPLIGQVEDAGFIKRSFEGSDAVYLMIPPNFKTPDYKAFTITVGKNYADAVRQTGVRHIVNLSSAGSALAGKPPLTHYQNLETWLDELSSINVLHLRPGGFYTNFYGSLGMIKHMGIIGNNFPDDIDLVMSHPADIAEAAAEAFHTLSFKGRNIRYIVSDSKNGKEIARILGTAVGRTDLKWVQFPDEQLLEGLLQNGFSRDAAQHYIVDMGIAIREGIPDKHYRQNANDVFGRRDLAAFAKEFAAVYRLNN